MVNFLQINLNGNWAAEQLMSQTAVETEADVLIVCEPFRHLGPEGSWRFSTERKAAVAITISTALTIDGQGSRNGYCWMRFQDTTVFSCYWRSGSILQEFATFLSDLEAAIRARDDRKIVLAGDFNA